MPFSLHEPQHAGTSLQPSEHGNLTAKASVSICHHAMQMGLACKMLCIAAAISSMTGTQQGSEGYVL